MSNKFLYWSPRILSVLFIIFLSIFALDVFGEYHGLALFQALFVHLLIPLILLLAVVLAWKWELIGAIVFIIFAIGYVLTMGFNRPWSWYVLVSGPSVIIGILFLLNWIQKIKKNNL